MAAPSLPIPATPMRISRFSSYLEPFQGLTFSSASALILESAPHPCGIGDERHTVIRLGTGRRP
jgi:hypothetical protein